MWSLMDQMMLSVFHDNFSKLALAILIVGCSQYTGAETRASWSTNPCADQLQKPSFWEESDSADWRCYFLFYDSTKTYSEAKAYVAQVKAGLIDQNLSTDSLGALFTEMLVHKIIPYWYGTPWSFEGHTAVPKVAEVACGYFVSTTLMHLGLKINRYKLAQQLPVHEAQSLALGAVVLEISGTSTTEIIDEMKAKLNGGIYFLGFDGSHVGFLYYFQRQLYVIHANYIGSGGVAVEIASESPAFASYRHFYVCPLSTNSGFLHAWQKNQVITVIETPND